MTARRPSARLALEDGAVFTGRAFGAVDRPGHVAAEVVFNTAMTGYQEALTDPSYAGQILVMTASMIGDYGVNAEDIESDRVHVSGFVVRELARRYSNFRATAGLDDYLRDAGVLGIEGVDTRALTKRLRVEGAMRGALTCDGSISDAELVERARTSPHMAGRNLVRDVSCSAPRPWTEPPGEWITILASSERQSQSSAGRRLRVLALDCGGKRNIYRHLTSRGCDVEIVPHDTPAEQIKRRFDAGEIDGVFISNGPGDPAAVDEAIATLRDLLGGAPDATPPTFGICLGHQLMGLALGGETFKLKFGHHGVNQPVYSALSGHVEITSQNHGFAVEPGSLASRDAEATHRNLNDGTLAGFRLTDRPVFAVQHHPEASPGPHDAAYLFDAFVRAMIDRRPLPIASAKVAGADHFD